MTEEAFIHHSCTRKKQYETLKKAENVIRNRKKRGWIVLVKPYKCKYCGLWHLGHPHEK